MEHNAGMGPLEAEVHWAVTDHAAKTQLGERLLAGGSLEDVEVPTEELVEATVGMVAGMYVALRRLAAEIDRLKGH